MQLEYIVPIFDFNYVGENKSSKDMWSDSSIFFENLKGCTVDNKLNIALKRFNDHINWDDFESDVLSKLDRDYLKQSQWYFEFNCENEKEDDYKLKLNLFLLAIRIVLQSDLSIKYIICKSAPHLSTRYTDDWKYAIASDKENNDTREFNKSNLIEAVRIYDRLKEFNVLSPRTSHAVNFLFLGYTSSYWMESYMLFMTALEALISPDNIGAIVSEVTNRLVKLIDDVSICSKSKFDKIYSLRSDIIHGRVLIDLNLSKELPRLQQLQIITLTSFKKILESDFLINYKDEVSKEIYYYNLLDEHK